MPEDSRSLELLAEELTTEEVRELLYRLNVRDMGGSEHATIGAVAEATGSDPILIGRLLGEIRKENFDERFGLKLDQHSKRIDTLEVAVKRAPIQRQRSNNSFDSDQLEILDQLADRERQARVLRPYALWFTIIFILILALARAACMPAAG